MIWPLLLLLASTDADSGKSAIGVVPQAPPAIAQEQAMPAQTGERWPVDTIVLLPPSDLKTLAAIKDDHDMDAVAAHLTKLGLKFLRGRQVVEVDKWPPELVSAIRKLPTHEPFLLPQEGVIVIRAIIPPKPGGAETK